MTCPDLTLKPTLVLEAEGLRCPEPVMMIRKSMRQLQSGDLLLVKADDPSTKRDVPSFCEFMDHRLVKAKTETLPFCYWIQKN